MRNRSLESAEEEHPSIVQFPIWLFDPPAVLTLIVWPQELHPPHPVFKLFLLMFLLQQFLSHSQSCQISFSVKKNRWRRKRSSGFSSSRWFSWHTLTNTKPTASVHQSVSRLLQVIVFIAIPQTQRPSGSSPEGQHGATGSSRSAGAPCRKEAAAVKRTSCFNYPQLPEVCRSISQSVDFHEKGSDRWSPITKTDHLYLTS